MAISNALAIGTSRSFPSRARAACARAGLSDGQILECYLAHHEETAFAAWLAAHGPMVWALAGASSASHQRRRDAAPLSHGTRKFP